MKKIITIITLFFTICFSKDGIPSALLDFSNYADDEQIDRPIERLTGFNPYNPVGVYTKSWNISTDDSIQRDVNIHLGTSFLIFSGVGINVKQYWFNSKYKAVSYFSSTSSSFSVILGMGKDAEGLGLDVHTIASGVDFNIIRFNRFDIGLSAGIFAGGSLIQMQGGAAPFLYFSLRTGS